MPGAAVGRQGFHVARFRSGTGVRTAIVQIARMRRLAALILPLSIVASLAVVAAPVARAAARPAGPIGLCRSSVDGSTVRPAPAGLLPAIARAFGVPADALASASSIRCSRGHLLACFVGANLSCGKADTRRHSVGAAAFCRRNPGAAIVPLVATGHDTIYTWRCVGAHAAAGPPVTAVDRHGFIRDNWKLIK